MKNKWIWAIVGVVILILIIVIWRAAAKAAESKEDQADRLADSLDDFEFEGGSITADERFNRREVRKTCRTCCRKGRTWAFGGRGRCRRECKAYGAANGLEAVKQKYCV